ncbi:bifunctional glutamate N-acetyltransferase/amino-acid acetyltransferase ArgJ [Shouchella lehensis]|uniref:Arginine biosynthesis bifunctional protein ArgJ n=2 Tax=Shouchella lehensis TaxID=300825 RepID=A0A060LY78_9BACI|nr:bifunctional glutamate N-acetyltransferase/amino-acid acetyltransferase ArgJ [Shouchella lehensis]AIC95122.1 bifunctional ornithine acetyltransferase/N-acetylglutamate synthase protein [Shouchella lehensis G1]RQW20942.1 bifunctional glutamate N-acetyltransferase/amino-acid acetyltransferase ArgJ [Bacillus sp. C1-1]TES50965.1 bifunctional glutamate N-acetyltransferase/amino-acid acetyltransferase ArgJ [Shouchella lehensis]
MILSEQRFKQINVIENGCIDDVQGFYTTGTHCGLKRKKPDLGLIYCENVAEAAGVFTTNQIQAAPLRLTKSLIETTGTLQAVVVNSGNANACTGKQGMIDAKEMQKCVAEKFNLNETDVAVSSTGVIGEQLPMDKVRAGINTLSVAESKGSFAEAILTTDTTTKEICVEILIDEQPVRIAGVAKGSGMIHPNMATMLSFLATDATMKGSELQQLLRDTTNETFNRITVDGDSSTNDMVLALASNKVQHKQLNQNHPQWGVFQEAFQLCATELAKMIARDGEGATKLIEVQVVGAKSNDDAGKIAKTIVGSDLVKTAVFGKDGNWGRIICAIGYSGCTISPDLIDIAIGPYATLKESEPCGTNDKEITAYMTEEETIVISVNLHVGTGVGKAWGCDLSYDYVRINAGYRT